MFVKIGRLINLYFIIIHKNAKKHYRSIAFYNFKIKCTRDKTELTFQN